ncbi:MAG: winged helix-turn-helix domain-containing protein [Chloroflexi bacterium]|nr:winged helix-turn-helix domain-containing protein [Chloroflexota bacterium]
MVDSREEDIRQELLHGAPLTTYELARKYKISNNTVSRIRIETGVPRSTLFRKVRSALEKKPDASDREIASELGISYTTVARHRQQIKKGQGSETQFDKGEVAVVEQAAIAEQSARKPRKPRQPSQFQKAKPDTPEWIWPRVKEVQITMRTVVTYLQKTVDLIEELTPYEPWIRWYHDTDPGKGSLARFLAERGSLAPEELFRRVNQFMGMVTEKEMEVISNAVERISDNGTDGPGEWHHLPNRDDRRQ